MGFDGTGSAFRIFTVCIGVGDSNMGDPVSRPRKSPVIEFVSLKKYLIRNFRCILMYFCLTFAGSNA